MRRSFATRRQFAQSMSTHHNPVSGSSNLVSQSMRSGWTASYGEPSSLRSTVRGSFERGIRSPHTAATEWAPASHTFSASLIQYRWCSLRLQGELCLVFRSQAVHVFAVVAWLLDTKGHKLAVFRTVAVVVVFSQQRMPGAGTAFGAFECSGNAPPVGVIQGVPGTVLVLIAEGVVAFDGAEVAAFAAVCLVVVRPRCDVATRRHR